MFYQTTLLETDLWEVWIEYDEFDLKHFGTLYVIGEVVVDMGAEGPHIRKGFSPNDRELVLRVASPSGNRTKRKEVLYSEPIGTLERYETVSIYANNSLLASFTDIEILI